MRVDIVGLPPDLILQAIVYMVAGSMHFIKPKFYQTMMPPYIPLPRACVAISGVAELALGVGLLFPGLRAAAAQGIMVLLVAVLPANVHMALNPDRFPRVQPIWLWLRVPLQVPLLLWAYRFVS